MCVLRGGGVRVCVSMKLRKGTGSIKLAKKVVEALIFKKREKRVLLGFLVELVLQLP